MRADDLAAGGVQLVADVCLSNLALGVGGIGRTLRFDIDPSDVDVHRTESLANRQRAAAIDLGDRAARLLYLWETVALGVGELGAGAVLDLDAVQLPRRDRDVEHDVPGGVGDADLRPELAAANDEVDLRDVAVGGADADVLADDVDVVRPELITDVGLASFALGVGVAPRSRRGIGLAVAA